MEVPPTVNVEVPVGVVVSPQVRDGGEHPSEGCSPLMGCDVRHLGAEGVAGTGFGVFGRCRVVVQLVSRWGGMVLAARGGGG